MKLLYEIVSINPLSKGCKMRVREYTKSDLGKFSDRGVAEYDTCRIEWTSIHGLQIDCFVRPDELLFLAEVLLVAYNRHWEAKQKEAGNSSPESYD
jgi:hypothetical protein